ncbi:MAG: metallophosphoesterase [Isosphaeraceae bacterium]
MSDDRLLIFPLALGQIVLFVAAFNVVHALGLRERAMKRVDLVLLMLFGTIFLIVAAEATLVPRTIGSWVCLLYVGFCTVTGLIVFPCSTILLRLRARPGGIERSTKQVDLAEGLGQSLLIGPGRYSGLLKLPGNQSFSLLKVECELALANLPDSLDGFSVTHLSDMHLATCFAQPFFEAILEEASTWSTDLVLFTGDLVDDDRAIDWIIPLFSRLRGRLGAFAILGNHDQEHLPYRIRYCLRDAGFTDLEGRWATVETRGKRLALGGTSYPWGVALPLDDIPLADFRIMLSHSPDQFYRAEKAGIDLLLSGHNHGGQIRLPLVGPVFMPSLYSRRFDRGFFRKNGLTMHVSQGIAGKHPVRYGCPPEITRLVLRSVPPERREDGLDVSRVARGKGLLLSGESIR